MSRRLALAAFWIAGTALAVMLASFGVQLAGDKVLDRAAATVSRKQAEADLATKRATDASTLPARPTGTDVATGAMAATGTTAATATRAGQAPPGQLVVPPTSSPAFPAASPPTVANAGPGSASGVGPATAASGGPGPNDGSPPPVPPPPPPVSTATGGSPPEDLTTIPATTGDAGSHSSPGGSPVTTTVPTSAPSSEQSYPLVGGTVRVGCVGSASSLVSAAPNTGFTMTVRSTGPQTVEVRFESTNHVSELKAWCANGQIVAEAKEASMGRGSSSAT